MIFRIAALSIVGSTFWYAWRFFKWDNENMARNHYIDQRMP